MPGSIDVDGSGPVLYDFAVPIAVAKYDGTSSYQLLPNVVCERIERQIGPVPSTARFRYVLDHSQPSKYPTQFEQVWPVTATGRFIVGNDDRVVVFGWTPEGDRRVLFDGFAQVPQANLSPDSQLVTFTAVGVECRCWDVPIGGRVQRDADSPTAGKEHQTDLPTRFNPSDGRGGVLPGCTPDGYDVNQSSAYKAYPVFLDERISRDPDPRQIWTVSRAVRYLIGVHNDQTYVRSPLFDKLTAKIVVKVPKSDDGPIDPLDPSTYTVDELPLRDLDVTNKPWPEAVDALLGQMGLAMFFEVGEDASGNPKTTLNVERRDSGTSRPLTLRLDKFRSNVDPARSNVASMALARDVNQVVNSWSIETPPARYEISVVLAPGFTPAAGDEVPPARNAFLKSRLADASGETQRKYRVYVADEAGDGHWSNSWITGSALDLSKVFPPNDDGTATYCRRLRPGAHRLISVDDQKRPRKAMLHYSQDYVGGGAGPAVVYPALWDGSGTWTEIPGGWNLLEDRLGIVVTIEDPEQWSVGKGKPDLRGITWQANPGAGQRFFLRLTTVIDDDNMLPATVPARVASPSKFVRIRRVDARDHYVRNVLAPWSHFNQADKEKVVRDDTDKAIDLARQYRAAHEMGPFSGSVTIPYLTDAYGLMDRIRKIEGRDVSLRSNIAADQGEGARYPFVCKYAWDFTGNRQATTLQLSDLRGEPRG